MLESLLCCPREFIPEPVPESLILLSAGGTKRVMGEIRPLARFRYPFDFLVVFLVTFPMTGLGLTAVGGLMVVMGKTVICVLKQKNT